MRKEYVLENQSKCLSEKSQSLSKGTLNQAKNQNQNQEQNYDEDKIISLKPETSKSSNVKGYLLFGTKTCPNCEIAKKILNQKHITYEFIDAEEMPDLTQQYEIMSAPTLIKINGSGYDKVVNASNIINYIDKL